MAYPTSVNNQITDSVAKPGGKTGKAGASSKSQATKKTAKTSNKK